MSSWLRADRGFVLFEVSVALALLSIGVIWMLRSFSQTLLAVERARDAWHAEQVIAEQALSAIIRSGVQASGEHGTTDRADWSWSLTTAPLTDRNSQLLQTDVHAHWMLRAQPRTVTATTWLPSAE